MLSWRHTCGRSIDTGISVSMLALCLYGSAMFAATPRSVDPPAKPFAVTHVNHLSLVVSDYAKSRDFYLRVFGMRLAWDDGKSCALEFGDLAAPDGMYLRGLNPGEHPGVNHIAFALEDFMARKAEMKAELDRRGLANLRADGAVGWSFNDPAGYPLNVVVVKHKAMFPGAASVCADAESAACAAAYATGAKNLEVSHAPRGRGLVATAFSHIVLRVADVPAELGFYRDVLGMRPIQTLAGRSASLRFGRNTLYLRTLQSRSDKPVVDHFAFVIDGWNRARVKATLQREGLAPSANSAMAWSVADPDGLVIEAAGSGLPEYVAARCIGHSGGANPPGCPGGADQ